MELFVPGSMNVSQFCTSTEYHGIFLVYTVLMGVLKNIPCSLSGRLVVQSNTVHEKHVMQVPLLAMLEEYNVLRQEKEEDKQRQRVSFILQYNERFTKVLCLHSYVCSFPVRHLVACNPK